MLGVRQNEISVNQSEATKKLTLVATIFLPLSFVVGFFGMNFGWMVDHVDSFAAFAAYGLGSLLTLLRGAIRVVPAQPLPHELP